MRNEKCWSASAEAWSLIGEHFQTGRVGQHHSCFGQNRRALAFQIACRMSGYLIPFAFAGFFRAGGGFSPKFSFESPGALSRVPPPSSDEIDYNSLKFGGQRVLALDDGQATVSRRPDSDIRRDRRSQVLAALNRLHSVTSSAYSMSIPHRNAIGDSRHTNMVRLQQSGEE